MVSTNHSQNLSPSSWQIPSEVSKQCAKGVQTRDSGASPQLLSPDTSQREPGNCVGEWWCRCRPTMTLNLQSSCPLKHPPPPDPVSYCHLYSLWAVLPSSPGLLFWSSTTFIFLDSLVRLMAERSLLCLWLQYFLYYPTKRYVYKKKKKKTIFFHI